MKPKIKIDFSKLDNKEQEIEGRSTGKYLRASKIKGKVVMRLLQDPRLNGDISVETVSFATPAGKSIIRTQKHLGDCEVYSAVQDAEKSSDKTERENAGKLRQRFEYCLPVLIVEEDKDGNIVGLKETIFQCPSTVYRNINGLVKNSKYRKVAEGSILDYEKGYNVTVVRKGEGLDTEYTVVPDPSPSDMGELLSNKDLKAVIEKAYDADEMISVLDALAENYDPAKELSKLNEYLETGSISNSASDN